MDREYSAEELNHLSKDALIVLFLSMQDQMKQLNMNMEKILEQIAVSNNHRFGRSTEKLEVTEGQLNFSDILNEAESYVDVHYYPEPDMEEVLRETPEPKKKKAKGTRENDLQGLPTRVTHHELPVEKLKELFGEHWKELPEEVYKRLHYQPAVYTVEEHHVHVYAGSDNETIVKADRPDDLLRNSIATPTLVASIMNAKYINAVPLYRQEQEYKRNGLHIRRQSMANWVIRCSEDYLGLLYDRLHRELYQYHVLQADETPVRVAKDGRAAGSKSFMWVYRTGKMYTDTPIILYEFQKTRNSEHPRKFLKDFEGVVVCDGYSAYHKLDKEQDNIRFAGCWAHARRKFSESLKALKNKAHARQTVSYMALEQIALIYKRDNELSKLTAEERAEKRNLVVRPLVESFFEWAKETLDTLEISPKSKTAEGLNYCVNQEKYLKVFLEDGEVPMDNNATEGALRGFCIGKHNWRVIDSIDGAKASAVIYSIGETAKANGLNPYEYYEYLLSEIPKHMEDKNLEFLDALLPWSPTLPERCHMKIGNK